MLPGMTLPIGLSGLFITNFSEYATGVQPYDWTSRWVSGGFTATVESVVGSISGKTLRWTKTAADRQFLSWDRVPIAADVEILICGRAISVWSNSANFIGTIGRGAGSAGSETGYRSIISGTTGLLQWIDGFNVYNAGSSTTLGTTTQGPAPTYTINTRFLKRCRISGTSISRKLWYYGTPEPVAWDATVVDATVTAPGLVGLSQVSVNPDMEIDYFGVSTNGATVPVPS